VRVLSKFEITNNSMGISGTKNGGTVPYFWLYFVGIFPEISALKKW
jgi:hypothetical protein